MLQVNLGMGTDGPDGGPLEMSNQIVPKFGILGPSNNPFPGTICLENISVPTDIGVKAGVNATIQIVMSAQHGAALFSVSSIRDALITGVLVVLYSKNVRLTRRLTVRRHYVCRAG